MGYGDNIYSHLAIFTPHVTLMESKQAFDALPTAAERTSFIIRMKKMLNKLSWEILTIVYH